MKERRKVGLFRLCYRILFLINLIVSWSDEARPIIKIGISIDGQARDL